MNVPGLRVVRNVSDALGLPRTARRIMESLARARRHMPVRELVYRVKMSERSVRKHLALLVRRGLLSRRPVVIGSRKIAYEYSLATVQNLLKATREDFRRTLERLEVAVRKLSDDSSPRSAWSLRS